MFNPKARIVFAREYTHRLKSKSFILSTILAPLALFAAIAIPVVTTVFVGDDTERTILIVNEAALDIDRLSLPGNVSIAQTELHTDSLGSLVLRGAISGFLELPAELIAGTSSARYVSRGGTGLQFRFELERSLEQLVRHARLEAAGVGDPVFAILEMGVDIESIRISAEGEDADETGIISIIGYVMALVIYISIFLYGSLVMRSVIEEKTNRVVEVVISSVRPFHLMLGKVLGVGAVGLTQMIIWLVAFAGLASVGGIVLSSILGLPTTDVSLPVETEAASAALSHFVFPELPASLFVYYILFFVGGYLLYASLFATIGSVVEQESDAQQFMLPIALPIVLSLLLLTRVVESPGSTLSVVASYIPLLAPVLMPVRGAVSPLAFWEMPLSLAILIATFGLTMWVCARVYRVGILMYGKKPTVADIIRWIRTD